VLTVLPLEAVLGRGGRLDGHRKAEAIKIGIMRLIDVQGDR
jgi:hypothetical protein